MTEPKKKCKDCKFSKPDKPILNELKQDVNKGLYKCSMQECFILGSDEICEHFKEKRPK